MTTVVDGLVFPEDPRWRDGTLWFSDIHGHRVHRVAVGADGSVGSPETVADLGHGEPSGLGWLADGRTLVVEMESRRLMRVEHDGSVVVHADLSSIVNGTINDMIVAADGTAYVGDMGFDIFRSSFSGPNGRLIRVDPDGTASIAADDLASPNGVILSADERTLIVAESAAMRLTAFSRAADGTLSDRRVFATLTPEDPDARFAAPDGICLDSSGAVWVADPMGRRVLRVEDGGRVLDSIPMGPHYPVACVLGGPSRRTLYVCAAAEWHRDKLEGIGRTGHIDALPVAVGGVGSP